MTFPIDYSIFLTIGIAIMLIFMAYQGFNNGLVVEIIDLVLQILCAVAAYFGAKFMYPKITLMQNSPINTNNAIADQTILNLSNGILWFIIIFIVAFIIAHLIRSLFKDITNRGVLGFINRLLGLIVGTIKGFIWMILIILLILSPFFSNGMEVIDQARLNPVKQIIHDEVPLCGTLIDAFQNIEQIRSTTGGMNESIIKFIDQFKGE